MQWWSSGRGDEMRLTRKKIDSKLDYSKKLLDLQYCDISDQDIPLVIKYLNGHPLITTLDISSNNIGTAAAKALAKITTLTMLHIDHNKIGIEGVQALAANTTLIKLHAEFYDIDHQCIQALAKNTTLTALHIWCKNIGVVGAKALAANTTLKTLYIGNSNIGSRGAQALAANSTITTLDVRNNGIGITGAKALAKNNTITKLRIFGNEIGGEGVKALIENNTITSLNIRNVTIGYEKLSMFVNTLKCNFTLVKLSHNFKEKSLKDYITAIITRNKALPWVNTIRHARLMAQAQRSHDCLLGTLPIELLVLINDYAVGKNHFTFFTAHFNKRPTPQDLIDAKQMGLLS